MPLGHFLRFRKWPGARFALFSAYRRARSVAEGSSASLIQSSKISERSLSSAKTCLEVFSGQCIFSCAESKSRSALNLSESERLVVGDHSYAVRHRLEAVARSESLVPAPTRSWMTLPWHSIIHSLVPSGESTRMSTSAWSVSMRVFALFDKTMR